MRSVSIRSVIPAGALLAALLFVPLVVAGQAPPAAIPRAEDGHPDFSGVWQSMSTAEWDLQDHAAQRGVPAGQGVVEGNAIPYLPAAAAKRMENFKNRATADPESRCDLPGVPRIMLMSYPFQIFQTSSQLTMLFEYVHAVRNVYTNGTPHPKGPIEWWMGDSRGQWQGDTMVIDSVHFNADTWFDRAGNWHSEDLHVVERISFIDRDHLNYEATIEDPKVFTKPWKISTPLYRRVEKGFRILEYECYTFDNEIHVTPPGTAPGR